MRPFLELPDENEEDEKKQNKPKEEMEVEEESEGNNDSDYDPNLADEPSKKGGKKKRKRSTKRKSKTKPTKKKGKKGGDNNGDEQDKKYTIYLAHRPLEIAESVAKTMVRGLPWTQFRSWLKHNMVPFCHHHPDKQEQTGLFERKMEHLLKFCTPLTLAEDNTDCNGHPLKYHCLWLKIPQKEHWLQLMINHGDWYTNCTSEQTMMTYETKPGSNHYWFFRIVENHLHSANTILLLRADKGGVCGELVWLQKGIHVSGTDALAIENAISEALDLKWTYLHDDSKINIPGNSTRTNNALYLKTIRSIAKGKSWYAQALYQPFSCSNWPSQSNILQTGVDVGTVFTQNAKEYKDAITYVRGMSVKQVRRLFIHNTNWLREKDLKYVADRDNLVFPPLVPSDIKEVDDVLANMNSYDPYYSKYGQPKRHTLSEENKDQIVDPRYFFKFSDDDVDDLDEQQVTLSNLDDEEEEEEDEDEDDANTIVSNDVDSVDDGKSKKQRKRGRLRKPAKKRVFADSFVNLTRRTRSRSRKDPKDTMREKLKENASKCNIGRWRRRRVKIKHSKDAPPEYVMRNEWDDTGICAPSQETHSPSNSNNNSHDSHDNSNNSHTQKSNEEKADNRVVIEYRKSLRTIGEVTGALYAESNPEFWGKNKTYGMKVIRGAKENMLKFFIKVLSSLKEEQLESHSCTPAFLKFNAALKSIENTKIFGKRGNQRSKAILHQRKLQQLQIKQQQEKQRQQQQQQQAQSYYPSQSTHPYYSSMYYKSQKPAAANTLAPLPLNSKENPINIPSSTNTSIHSSPNKRKKSASPRIRQSEEPLFNVASQKQFELDRRRAVQPPAQAQYQQHQIPSLYQRRQYNAAQRNNPMYYPSAAPYAVAATSTHPPWAYRGYGTSSALHSGIYPPPFSTLQPSAYYTGFNQQLRHELAGDAEKLKLRQMQEKQKLDDHKSFLERDLDSHLAPTPSSSHPHSPSTKNQASTHHEHNNNDNSQHNANVISVSSVDTALSQQPAGSTKLPTPPQNARPSNERHKELFESLKAPMGVITKKTVQPPLRVHKNLVDTISNQAHSNSRSHSNSPLLKKAVCKPQSLLKPAENINKNSNDTDSTLSTLTMKSQNNDSDCTANMNGNHNVNINMKMPENVIKSEALEQSQPPQAANDAPSACKVSPNSKRQRSRTLSPSCSSNCKQKTVEFRPFEEVMQILINITSHNNQIQKQAFDGNTFCYSDHESASDSDHARSLSHSECIPSSHAHTTHNHTYQQTQAVAHQITVASPIKQPVTDLQADATQNNHHRNDADDDADAVAENENESDDRAVKMEVDSEQHENQTHDSIKTDTSTETGEENEEDDDDNDEENKDAANKAEQRSYPRTRSQTKQQRVAGTKRSYTAIEKSESSEHEAQSPKKKIKLSDLVISPSKLPKFDPNMSTDELIEEIRKYDADFEVGANWCRFCGSDVSAKWNVQNRITLCDVHNRQYKKNKRFKGKINGYKRLPKKAIDPSKNTQHEFLKSKLKSIVNKQKRLRKSENR